MRRWHSIWLGLGFGIFPFFVLFLGYLNIHPEFFRRIPSGFGVENTAAIQGIAWEGEEKENPPLEYVSDGFTAIRIVTEPINVASFWDLWNAPASEIEYEWRYKVKNLTKNAVNISVNYKLEDGSGFVIQSSRSSILAEPGETVEFKEIEKIEFQKAKRVKGSGWSIGRQNAQ